MRRVRFLLSAWLTLGIALIAAGCATTSSPRSVSSAVARPDLVGASPTELAAFALKRAVLADSITLTADSTDENGLVHSSLRFRADDASGELTTAGMTIRLLRVGGMDYLQAPQTFWEQAIAGSSATLVAATNGKWVSFDHASSTFRNAAGLLDRKSYLGGELTLSGKASKLADGAVDGVACFVVKDARPNTLYLAKDDARPLKIVSAAAGTVLFSYDSVDGPLPPSATDVVAASKLGLT